MLPPRMADPEYLPAMCPSIQKACTEFPLLASKIIAAYGFHAEDFNTLHQKMENNALFRYRVQREIKKIEQVAASRASM